MWLRKDWNRSNSRPTQMLRLICAAGRSVELNLVPKFAPLLDALSAVLHLFPAAPAIVLLMHIVDMH